MATRANAICAVCDVAIAGAGGTLNLNTWTCDRCGGQVHEACYWGRTVSLAEWRDYVRDLEESDDTPSVICSTCRALLLAAAYGKKAERLGKESP